MGGRATTLADGLVVNEDGIVRCWWGAGDSLEYRAYHDDEWGRPVVDDVRLFEKLCLEGFQSGLSWLTILRKRDAFRRAFHGFVPARVAALTPADVEDLLQDASIVRHRGKIVSTINNAERLLELVAEHDSLAAFVWSFEPDPAARPTRIDHAWLMQQAQTDASRALAKELKRRGWTYVGPTTVYAFMQAMGLVNDHLEGCHARGPCATVRASLSPPRPG
jgi:DNA-3-methyladenine glycosylase I